MRVVINHNGFHGYSAVSLNLKGSPGDLVQLSQSQAKKLNDTGCGVNGCLCGECLGGACDDWADYTYYYDVDHLPHIRIPIDGTINLIGRYAQR